MFIKVKASFSSASSFFGGDDRGFLKQGVKPYK